SWEDLELVDHDVPIFPNADGTFNRRRYYRKASWMQVRSTFRLEQLDSGGKVLGPAVELNIGNESKREGSDDFFVRRLRAIQWTYGCASPSDCSNSSTYQEEALVEVRNAMEKIAFSIQPGTT